MQRHWLSHARIFTRSEDRERRKRICDVSVVFSTCEVTTSYQRKMLRYTLFSFRLNQLFSGEMKAPAFKY